MANDPVQYDFGRTDIGAESTLLTESSNYRTTNAAILDRGSLEVAALRPGAQTAENYSQGVIVGKSGGTLTTRHELHGWNTSIPSAAPTWSYAVATPSSITLAEYIAAALGNGNGGGYNATVNYEADALGSGVSTTSTLIVADTDLDTFIEGQAVCWDNGSSVTPRYEANWLKNLDTSGGLPDTATLLLTATTAPAGTSAKLWGSVTVFQKTGNPYYDNATKSWSIKYTDDDGNVVTNLGCRPTACQFEFTDGELSAAVITWGVSSWTEATGGTLSVGTYSYPDAEAFIGAWITFSDASAPSNATSYRIQGLSVDLGMEAIPIMDPSKTDGVAGHLVTRRNPSISFSVYRDLDEEVADFEAQTGKTFALQMGSQPGKMIAMVVPNAIITALPSTTNLDGMIGTTVTIEAGNYTGDNDAAADTSPVNTNFRIAFI